MLVKEIISSLGSTSKRNEKIEILENEWTDTLGRVLYHTYNPFTMFGVKNVHPVYIYGHETIDSKWDDIEAILGDLSSRAITGNFALDVIAGLMSTLTKEDAEIFHNILKKDQRCGLADKTINKVKKNLIPTFDLMLCSQEKNSKVKFPCYSEVKLDGLRLCALYDGDSVKFLSRSGKPFDSLYHLEDSVIKFLDGEPGMLDGEIMGDSFNSTVAGVRRGEANPDSLATKFYVYDHLTLEEFQNKNCERKRSDRYEFIVQRSEELSLDEESLIQVVRATVVNSMEEARDMFEHYISGGFEGSILKDFDNLYEFKRVRTMTKLKPSETVDLNVIGVVEGEGKYKGMLGALIVEFEGKEARVGSGFSDEERREFWRSPPLIVEVSFMERTSSIKDAGGSMRHAVFKRVRSFKGSKV